MKPTIQILIGLFLLMTLNGCLSPVTLKRAVTAYDDAVVDADNKQLLINIARAHNHQPIHFTRVSSIAATFDFTANAGATPALTGERGGMLAPIFGVGVAERPTFSIDPIASEEFTQRLLTPFSQHKLMLLLRQHFDIDLMLRMMAQEVRLLDPERPAVKHHAHKNSVEEGQQDGRWYQHRHRFGLSETLTLTDEQQYRQYLRHQMNAHLTNYQNKPKDRTGYEIFRRVVLHLASIQDQGELHAEPLIFERNWTIPASSVSAEGFQSLEKEYSVEYNAEEDSYTVSRRVVGPILITNYNPDSLCCEQREDLYHLTDPWIENDVAFDIRPGYTGGEWPVRGTFRLRSFHSILHFLGHAHEEEQEYHVEKDPRTTLPVAEDKNPTLTMGLLVSDKPIPEVEFSVYSNGQYYAVNTKGKNAHWNRNAFQLLYNLYRLTVTDAKSLGLPVTISK